MLEAKTCVCPCGNVVDVPVIFEDSVIPAFHGEQYDVSGVECPACGRRSSGGNFKTGEVSGWNTAASIARSNAEYERQMFESDMNEWYGRGEW